MKIPRLESERLILRAPTPHDIDWFYSIRSNEDFMRYMHRPIMTDRKEAEAFVGNFWERAENETGLQWVLESKETGEVVGYAGPWRWDKSNRTAELGYGLDPNQTGKGYMREAIETCIRYAFENLEVERVEAWMEDANVGSRKVAEYNGMRYEGTLRHAAYSHGQFRDLLIFSILSHEWHDLKAK